MESGGTRGSIQAAAFATITFGVTTPQGIAATYLILSGMFRAATAYVGDWYGDPLLTAIVTAAVSTTTHTRDSVARADRLRREGIEEPDRVYSGEWTGLPQAELVIVACRRKRDWRAGVVVITANKAYRLGEPFDQTTPGGLRTIYSLTPFEPGEMIRRSVAYDLPPLRED